MRGSFSPYLPCFWGIFQSIEPKISNFLQRGYRALIEPAVWKVLLDSRERAVLSAEPGERCQPDVGRASALHGTSGGCVAVQSKRTARCEISQWWYRLPPSGCRFRELATTLGNRAEVVRSLVGMPTSLVPRRYREAPPAPQNNQMIKAPNDLHHSPERRTHSARLLWEIARWTWTRMPLTK